MDRETALQNYREAVSRKIAAFRSHMGDSVLEHAEDWEGCGRKSHEATAGEQMEKTGKGVCMFFVFFSVRSQIRVSKENYRLGSTGLLIWARLYGYRGRLRQYVVIVKELLTPWMNVWNELVCANQGYGVLVVNEWHDIQNLLVLMRLDHYGQYESVKSASLSVCGTGRKRESLSLPRVLPIAVTEVGNNR
ncbi:MAG: hypothetical protein ACLVGL_17180 [Waltera sp.]